MNNTPFSLNEKTILVTGASSGIGKACAIECSKMGAKLIITGRNGERLNQTLGALKGQGHTALVADLSIEDDINNLASEIGILDGLILNAGTNHKALVKFISRKLLDEMFSVNFYAPALLVQKLVKQKKLNRGASIVFMSSIATSYASISLSVYAASKGAINSFMRVLALELSSQKIRVNAIQPGMVKTKALGTYTLREELDAWEKSIPLGRAGEPEDIAFASIYLLSDASQWVTGTIMNLDGGVTLR